MRFIFCKSHRIGAVETSMLQSFGAIVNAWAFTLFVTTVTGFFFSATAQEQNKTPDVVAKSTAAEAKPLAVPLSDDKSQRKIKVVFDETSPGVVIIESNGEKIRVDTGKKTVEQIPGNSDDDAATSASADAKQKTTDAPPSQEEESAYDFDKGEEPYDFRVVNVPTPKNIPKGTWNLVFTHRFTQPLHPLSSSARNLLGLDSFGVASFGVSYGITDKLYVSAYRSPLCQRGLCRVIEVGVGYNWLAQDKKSPIALTTFASIEGNDNFTEEFTYNLQAMISVRLGKRVYVFFSPAAHINANGQRRFDPRANDFFPPATVANNFRLPTHGASFGFGTSVLITPNIVALFDFAPRTGFKLGQTQPIFDNNFRVIGFRHISEPSIGFGIQRNVGKHAFALTFSNTQSTTTSRYNSSNLGTAAKRLIIGFNLSRRF